MPTCEAVTAHRFFGSQVCGVEATKKVENPWGYQNEVYLCDEHYAEYFGAFLEREYTYYHMCKEEGSETDMEHRYPEEYYELTEELQRLYEADTQNKERLIKEGRGKLNGELDTLLSIVDQMDDTTLHGRAFKRLLYKLLQNLKKINNPTK